MFERLVAHKLGEWDEERDDGRKRRAIFFCQKRAIALVFGSSVFVEVLLSLCKEAFEVVVAS
jgi:hypothetical protein